VIFRPWKMLPSRKFKKSKVFFANQVGAYNELQYPKKGDFFASGKYLNRYRVKNPVVAVWFSLLDSLAYLNIAFSTAARR